MLSNFRHLLKKIPKTTDFFKININKRKIHQTLPIFTSPDSKDIEIVDVNIDKMMHEDGEFASNFNYEPPPQLITSTDIDGVPLAPIDIDPWNDEEIVKAGTVDMEYVEQYKGDIKYPDPPKERSGFYEYEGIKIWLPQKMLSPSTYRYRLDEGEEEILPDDIRICRYDKKTIK